MAVVGELVPRRQLGEPRRVFEQRGSGHVERRASIVALEHVQHPLEAAPHVLVLRPRRESERSAWPARQPGDTVDVERDRRAHGNTISSPLTTMRGTPGSMTTVASVVASGSFWHTADSGSPWDSAS